MSTAREFLTPHANQIHEPYLMLGMRDAVARIQRAIDGDEPILIYGDYDVDGLEDLAKASNPGLRGFMEAAGCGDGKGMTAYDQGFRIGPRKPPDRWMRPEGSASYLNPLC